MEPIFSLCYTSRRPKMIADVVRLWHARAADDSKVEVVLVVDADDAEGTKVGKELEAAGLVRFFVQESKPYNCVKGWNLAASKSVGKLIICMSDDFVPPKGWDKGLLDIPVVGETIKDGLPTWFSKSRLVHINDGYIEHIATLAIITKVRFDEFGYVFYPEYESMFCDTDMTERAKLDGAVIPARHLYFEHLHPTNNKRARDEVDNRHDSRERWARGETMFELRKQAGYPKPGEDMKIKFCAYVMANKDDLCTVPVCKRLLDQGVNHFFFCVNNEYWSGRVTTEDEVNQVVGVAEKLRQMGATCFVSRFSTLPYRNKGLKRLEIETYVRNDHLAWIRTNGFFHILIVDSDELFKPDLMKSVETAVRLYTPDAIKCWRIPVVSLPGILVDNPRDNPEIYVGNWATFTSCREVRGKSVLINGFGVYHFTAVRPTMDLIVDKHRESGHYDDANYDFEGWIENVLPKIDLTTKRVHMYRGDNIWPGTRPWTKEELSWIPEEMLKWCDVKNAVDAKPPTGPTGGIQAPQSFQKRPRQPEPPKVATPFPTPSFVPTNLYRYVG